MPRMMPRILAYTFLGATVALLAYSYIDLLNENTRLRLLLPNLQVRSKHLQELIEETHYEVAVELSPSKLQKLWERPTFSYLHPLRPNQLYSDPYGALKNLEQRPNNAEDATHLVKASSSH